MARLQYKICTTEETTPGGYQDVLVFTRTVDGPDGDTPWKCIAVRRPYIDPIWSTHGRRLKALLRSLA